MIRIGFLTGVMLAALLGPAQAQEAQFKSPHDAVAALVAAVQASDSQKLMTILGPESKDIVTTGDPVADKEGRRRFLSAHKSGSALLLRNDGSVVLRLGKDNWPFPIPLVKQGNLWHFDTASGHEEIVNRRIGANELQALQVCREYVESQREYFSQCRQGDAIVEYAQHFLSHPGQHDGLYWKVKLGEELSPMGPLVAQAEAEGYSPGAKQPGGFHGYRFHILTSQGAHAPGGAYSYVINGHMVAGFALAAYPAEPGKTGILTYIVNQNGIIYRKDLGADTEAQVKAMDYDPDDSWKRI